MKETLVDALHISVGVTVAEWHSVNVTQLRRVDARSSASLSSKNGLYCVSGHAGSCTGTLPGKASVLQIRGGF